jgi:acyl carrier protein|tara:strand:- start:423 stop:665 length:243 start_codon:yes stop_codon:yes gene_type:complete
MSNIKKYNDAFCETFEIELENLDELEYQSIQAWDSVGHMALMATLEESLEIEMEIDDIIEFSSYKFGKEVVKKYGVDLDE